MNARIHSSSVPDSVYCQILELLDLPAATACNRGPVVALSSKENPSYQSIVPLFCNSWKCHPCAARHKRKWGLHLGISILLHHRSLSHLEINPEEWTHSVRDRFRRKKISWACIKCHGHPTTIISNSTAGAPMVSKDAIKTLRQSLARIIAPYASIGRFRPVSTNMTWTMGPKPSSKWERTTFVSARNTSLIQNLIGDHGIDSQLIRMPDTSTRIQYTIPENWTSEDVATLNRALRLAAL